MGSLAFSRPLVIIMGTLLFACVAVAPLPARADTPSASAKQDAAARGAFAAGREAYERGSFAEALARFEEAYTLSPRPALLYNIGRAADSDGKAGRAISAYTAYLEAFPSAANAAFVRARLEKMRELEQMRAQDEVPLQAPASALPSVAASTAPVEVASPSAATLPRHDDAVPARPVWKRVWFWSVIGGVVVAGVTASVIATRDRGPERSPADLHFTTSKGDY